MLKSCSFSLILPLIKCIRLRKPPCMRCSWFFLPHIEVNREVPKFLFSQWGHLHHRTWWQNHRIRMLERRVTPSSPATWQVKKSPLPRNMQKAQGSMGLPTRRPAWTLRVQDHITSSFDLNTGVSWWKHFAGDISLFIPQESCVLQWAMCIMCSRLCLNDVFLQPKTDKFRWFVPYFCTFRNSWLIDWIFNFSQQCLMLGRLCLSSPLRNKKIYIKVSFPINIFYLTEWLWTEIPWLMRRFFFPHITTRGSFSKVIATHLGNLPINPSSEFSCHQTILSHFRIGFKMNLFILLP